MTFGYDRDRTRQGSQTVRIVSKLRYLTLTGLYFAVSTAALASAFGPYKLWRISGEPGRTAPSSFCFATIKQLRQFRSLWLNCSLGDVFTVNTKAPFFVDDDPRNSCILESYSQGHRSSPCLEVSVKYDATAFSASVKRFRQESGQQYDMV